jgi:hypothetical protein
MVDLLILGMVARNAPMCMCMYLCMNVCINVCMYHIYVYKNCQQLCYDTIAFIDTYINADNSIEKTNRRLASRKP